MQENPIRHVQLEFPSGALRLGHSTYWRPEWAAPPPAAGGQTHLTGYGYGRCAKGEGAIWVNPGGGVDPDTPLPPEPGLH